MIRLLLILHPRAWRARYGEEFRALLEAAPLTLRVVLDVLRNAGGQQLRAHARALRVLAAVALSAVVEVAALRADLTANILWPPSTPLRALVLLAVLAPWVPVAADVGTALRRRCSRVARRA